MNIFYNNDVVIHSRVNCSFYFKIGACRHGDRCSRIHNKPTFSQTILLQNLYHNPQNTAQTADGSHTNMTEEEMQEHFDNFFEDVFVELEDKYGEIEEMNVCDNLGDHLVGNVYVKVGHSCCCCCVFRKRITIDHVSYCSKVIFKLTYSTFLLKLNVLLIFRFNNPNPNLINQDVKN